MDADHSVARVELTAKKTLLLYTSELGRNPTGYPIQISPGLRRNWIPTCFLRAYLQEYLHVFQLFYQDIVSPQTILKAAVSSGDLLGSRLLAPEVRGVHFLLKRGYFFPQAVRVKGNPRPTQASPEVRLQTMALLILLPASARARIIASHPIPHLSWSRGFGC